MEAAFHPREKTYSERKAYSLANSPVLQDVTIQFWFGLHRVDHTTVTTLQQTRDADFDDDGIPNYDDAETPAPIPSKK